MQFIYYSDRRRSGRSAVRIVFLCCAKFTVLQNAVYLLFRSKKRSLQLEFLHQNRGLIIGQFRLAHAYDAIEVK